MTTATDAPATTTEPAAVKSALQLFRWSTFVHVGEGAEECPGGTDGTCTDPSHFHAWVRLPNKFQEEEIQEKALAARARRLRLIRDPESDLHLLMEEEIQSALKTEIVEELLAANLAEDEDQARFEVMEENREKFEHIFDDLERYIELRDMGPEKRGEAAAEPEFLELDRHLNEYHELLGTKKDMIQNHRRSGLESLPDHDLRGQLRERRLDVQGTQAFFRARQIWIAIAGTYKPSKTQPFRERWFKSESDLRDVSEDVLEAIFRSINELQMALERGGGRGN